MGAWDDTQHVRARTEAEALAKAEILVQNARYEHGFGGYSGTIAEADGVHVLSELTHTEAEANALLFGTFRNGRHIGGRCEKYGPAWLVRLTADTWLLGCRAAS